LYHPDLALLPVGGSYTMGPVGAAKSIELLGVKNVVPMHYGTFAFLKGTPRVLAKLQRDPQVRIFDLELGRTYRAEEFWR
jgi:L-ascorbate metabolism protein UlaG (beta-lactamase superfamily)